MTESTNTLIFLITIVAVLVTLLIPLPIQENYRLVIITAFILLFIGIILSSFGRKIDYHEEKLKIHEQLIDIKKDIELLKEKAMKK